MSIIVIGKGDRLALPKLMMCQSSFGSSVHYTRPNYNRFYSTHGFNVPLNYEAIPLHLILDNKLPKITEHIERFENCCDYLQITEDGLVWIVSTHLRDEGRRLSHEYIDCDESNGWWTNISPTAMTNDQRSFMGFLYTNPSEDMINDYLFSYCTGERLEWFSISEIAQNVTNIVNPDKKEISHVDPDLNGV